MDCYEDVHENLKNERRFQLEREKYYKFTYVRNPFARLVSCYKNKCIMINEKDTGDLAYFKRNNYLMSWMADVEDFVHKIVDIPNEWMDRLFRLQYDLIYQNDICLVDFVGKLEEINSTYSILQEKYGLGNLEVYNATGNNNWKDYYNKELVELVYEKYKKDIETFGYQQEYIALKNSLL